MTAARAPTLPAGNPTIDGLAIDPRARHAGRAELPTAASPAASGRLDDGGACAGATTPGLRLGHGPVLYATAGYQNSAYTSFTCCSVDGGAN
jgi:hypothetical protein